jgi:hypothetical protein
MTMVRKGKRTKPASLLIWHVVFYNDPADDKAVANLLKSK